jgi:hypothetical protein
MDAGAEEIPGALDVDAQAAGGVFSVGDNEIDIFVAYKRGDEIPHGVPCGTPHDIAKYQDTHGSGLDHFA